MVMSLHILANFLYIQRLTTDHPLQNGKSVAVIKKNKICDTNHLSELRLKFDVLNGLNFTQIRFIDPSTNEGES
jgi:hypothetical protein